MSHINQDEDELKLTSLDAGFEGGRHEQREQLLPTTQQGAPQPATPIAYLDGLRGLAAVMVYFQHHVTSYYGDGAEILKPYGHNGSHHLAALPFIRIFVTGGSAAVMIFFVLSGYVLSRSALRMARDGQSPNKSLLSALVRRPIRLFMPPACISIFCAISQQLPFRPLGDGPPVHANIVAELWNWACELLKTFNPFIAHGPWIQWFTYDPPVWTMAYEFNGSLLVFATVALYSRYFSAQGRAIMFALTAVICWYTVHWAMPCFLIGVVLSQNDVAGLDQAFFKRLPPRVASGIYHTCFFLGWFMLSMVRHEEPADEHRIPAASQWQFLRSFVPSLYFDNPWLPGNMIGAALVIYALLRLPWLQSFFNSLKRLGKVSFAFYLVHVPFLWIVGNRFNRFLGQPVPEGGQQSMFDGILHVPDIGPPGFSTRYLIAQAVILPLTLAVSELAMVWFDEPAVTLSRAFANKVLGSFKR
ncbi:hypothetical protein K461DRAFT_273908 [Myriangium duriaei CBS 260.36]|uniref:Acyltransferase 3 domain-containing protein n=1 Tax=Myriangium duriaei CBS 260.36 TaxID=1168546 RepID=A0A9P4J9A3_9PEZI|nr:hypothetical protein K461DRAFT_273908 [Myriangium duriaei CBS 260.36]